MDQVNTEDVQNTTTEQTTEGALLRKQMGLITPPELAGALGVSEVTLQVWRQKGTGPKFTKLGKNIFYPMREVRHWTETNVLDRVNERAQERLYPDASSPRYKTGELVNLHEKVFPTEVTSNISSADASSADEIDQALTKLIGHIEND